MRIPTSNSGYCSLGPTMVPWPSAFLVQRPSLSLTIRRLLTTCTCALSGFSVLISCCFSRLNSWNSTLNQRNLSYLIISSKQLKPLQVLLECKSRYSHILKQTFLRKPKKWRQRAVRQRKRRTTHNRFDSEQGNVSRELYRHANDHRSGHECPSKNIGETETSTPCVIFFLPPSLSNEGNRLGTSPLPCK